MNIVNYRRVASFICLGTPTKQKSMYDKRTRCRAVPNLSLKLQLRTTWTRLTGALHTYPFCFLN